MELKLLVSCSGSMTFNRVSCHEWLNAVARRPGLTLESGFRGLELDGDLTAQGPAIFTMVSRVKLVSPRRILVT
jgi:hypothetical protein